LHPALQPDHPHHLILLFVASWRYAAETLHFLILALVDLLVIDPLYFALELFLIAIFPFGHWLTMMMIAVLIPCLTAPLTLLIDYHECLIHL
jgi:hypothetical protein